MREGNNSAAAHIVHTCPTPSFPRDQAPASQARNLQVAISRLSFPRRQHERQRSARIQQPTPRRVRPRLERDFSSFSSILTKHRTRLSEASVWNTATLYVNAKALPAKELMNVPENSMLAKRVRVQEDCSLAGLSARLEDDEAASDVCEG